MELYIISHMTVWHVASLDTKETLILLLFIDNEICESSNLFQFLKSRKAFSQETILLDYFDIGY